MRGVYLFAWIWFRMLNMIAPQPGETIEISNYYRRPMTRNHKIGNDFEWAFLTVPLGFVDDEYEQDHPLWANFMTQYSQFISQSEAYNTRITKSYYEGREEKLCKAYLSDPFFKSNRIKFEPPTDKNQCRFELKSVNFQYFSRISDFIKVIACPVWIGQTNQESRLYFHEFHFTWPYIEQVFRGYFVFANTNMVINQPGRQNLELLMYTSRNRKRLPRIDYDPESEEAEFRDTRNRKIVNLPNIRLYIEVPHFARQDVRKLLALQSDMSQEHLFGEEAELCLLSRIYGFFDHIHSYWQKKTLILMLNRMSNGYELNRIAMEIARKSDTKITCINYINNNEMLNTYRYIFVNEFLPSSEFKWTTKLVLFPMTNFLPDGQYYELLECPVIHYEYASVYILPVFYMAFWKLPKVFSFVEDDENPGGLLPLFYSPVDPTNFVLPDLIDLSEPLPEEWLG